jgi:methionyl-tRNA formyltransferase
LKLRVAFAGTPEFALPALESLRARQQLVGILTQPDRPGGRGRKLTPSAVKRAALAAQLPLAQPATLRSESALAVLAAWRPEVLVVVAYGLLLPREVLTLPRFGCVNIHASLLPRWRGAAPIERAILAGDAETGVSIMQMEEGLDSGPLLLQRRLAIRSDHTGGSLRAELAPIGAAALLEALDGLEAGALRPVAQGEIGVTYAAKIQKAEARIDWGLPAAEIERQVRAFNPSPVAETSLGGEQLRIFAAHVLSAAGPRGPGFSANLHATSANFANPGVIVDVRDETMVIRCGGGGYLGVTQVQRPGRRPVNVRDYSHGVSLVGRQLV